MLDLFALAGSSVSASGARLSPELFVDLPYTPALLLDARFGAEITNDPEFARACADGYDCYFEELYDYAEDGIGEVFVDHVYTWAEIEEAIVDLVIRRYDLAEEFYGVASLARRAGLALGWLSGLALSDRGLALRGLSLLHTVVCACQREEAALC